MTKGQRIKSKREEMGISQSGLAEAIGVSKQTLYKYENDIVSNIPSDKVEALATSLDTTPQYIMGWKEGGMEIEVESESPQERAMASHRRLSVYAGHATPVRLNFHEMQLIRKYRKADKGTRKAVDLLLSQVKVTE